MRYLVVIIALLLLLPFAANAGDCGKCGKCGPCKTSCGSCKSDCAPKCSPSKSECKPKCDSCAPKCNSCKPACAPQTCTKCNTCAPKCSPCKQNSCSKPCGSCGKCNAAPSCNTGCAAPCACDEWNTYCGCGSLTGLCISLRAACNDGTAAPVFLVLRDSRMNELATIELSAPIEGYYQTTYTFEEPLDATAPVEALLLNDNEDTVTLEWLSVTGLLQCGSFTYFDHACPGVVIGQGGCPRMVLF
jgi:hypothetical protein